MNQNSLLYWYPRIKDLPIPQPRTKIVDLDASYSEILAVVEGNPKAVESKMAKIELAMYELSIPFFLRTAYTAGKHDWLDTCYVTDFHNIRRHIAKLIEDSAMKEIPVDALVFREYIEMDSQFTAFWGKMPVNPERRHFIRNGAIQCRHSYWIEEAIADFNEPYVAIRKSKLASNWRELLADMNVETDEEVELLTGYAEQVARVMEGYWSVDFCKAKDGRWILIDMALGKASWHDERCEYA